MCLLLGLGGLCLFGTVPDAARAQAPAGGFWSQAPEASTGEGSGPRPPGSSTVELPPRFSQTPRSVILQILGVTRTINVLEGMLDPPPTREPVIDVQPAWYLPPGDKITNPAPPAKFGGTTIDKTKIKSKTPVASGT